MSTQFNPQIKIKPIESERFKKFIRGKPCRVCGTWLCIQAAHQNVWGGVMGGKVSDLQTLPLCASCHRECDQLKDKLRAAIAIIKNINEFFALGYKL